MQTLDLGLIGNGTISALITPQGDIVWSCMPRFDGDPVFSSLLTPTDSLDASGKFAIEVADLESSEQ